MPETPSSVDNTLILLEGLDSFTKHTVQIIERARRQVSILSYDLNLSIYNNNDVATALSSLARGDRNSQVCILVKQTRPLIESNHQILQLSRRLPSKIKIRKLLVAPEDNDRAYLVADYDRLLYQHQEGEYIGFANYAAKPEAQKIIEEFSYLWQHQSAEDSELRSFIL